MGYYSTIEGSIEFSQSLTPRMVELLNDPSLESGDAKEPKGWSTLPTGAWSSFTFYEYQVEGGEESGKAYYWTQWFKWAIENILRLYPSMTFEGELIRTGEDSRDIEYMWVDENNQVMHAQGVVTRGEAEAVK